MMEEIVSAAVKGLAWPTQDLSHPVYSGGTWSVICGVPHRQARRTPRGFSLMIL